MLLHFYELKIYTNEQWKIRNYTPIKLEYVFRYAIAHKRGISITQLDGRPNPSMPLEQPEKGNRIAQNEAQNEAKRDIRLTAVTN